MLLRFTFLLAAVLPAFFAPAQTDSIVFTIADTAKVKQLLDEATRLVDSASYDAGLGKLDEALHLAEQLVGKEELLYAEVLEQKSRCFFETGKYAQAEEYAKKILEIRLLKLGADHPKVAVSLNSLGAIYLVTGNMNQAAEYFQKALDNRLKSLGANSLETAVSYNNLGTVFREKGEYEKAEEFIRKSLTIRLEILGENSLEAAQSYHNLGNIYEEKSDLVQAIFYFIKALKIRQHILPGNHPEIADTFNDLGNAYFHNGDYDEALDNYSAALNIWENKFPNGHPNIAIALGNIGAVSHSKGDYRQAIINHQKSLSLKLKLLRPNHPSIASAYYNLAIVYKDKGDFYRAIEFYQKALNIDVAGYGAEHANVAYSLNGLGNVHTSIGDYKRAAEYHRKALEIRQKVLPPQHPGIGVSLHNLADVYFFNHDYEQAAVLYQKALEIWKLKFGEDHPYIASVFNNLSDLNFRTKEYDKAAEYCLKALAVKQLDSISIAGYSVNMFKIYGKMSRFDQAEFFIRQSLDALHYSEISSFERVVSFPVLMETLAAKGNFYLDYFAATQSPPHLRTARQAFAEAAAAIAWQRQHLENPGSKSALANEAHGIYEGGIASSLLLRRLTDSLDFWRQAFDYAEKSKALLLYESMREADALHFAGIPGELLQKEYDLRVDMTYFEKKRHEKRSQGMSETDTALLALSGKLFDLNRDFEALKKRLEIEFPEYFRLKYDLSVPTVGEVQQQLLRPEQTLVEYFTGDSSIFIFVLGKETFEAVEIKKDFPLEEWVEKFRRSVVDNYSTGAAEYAGAAWQLYEKLILPIRHKLTEELVIVPDGVLGYLPFEALLSEMPEKPIRFKDHRYLLHDFRISYCPSATLLREMQQKRHREAPQKTLLAFAPYFDGDTSLLAAAFPQAEFRKDLLPLKFSGAEAAGAQKLLGGDVFLGKEATEERFVQSAASYRILHLATHGKANDQAADYSFLAFSEIKDSLENELLYVRDLYNLSLNADLVTLSACETGIGKLERGEGILSLARAFTYAGAKSIVTTLWSVQDESTKDLMLAFYHNLKKGMRKDEALRQAKLAHLSKHDHAGAHPFFWAGVAAMGDMGALFEGK